MRLLASTGLATQDKNFKLVGSDLRADDGIAVEPRESLVMLRGKLENNSSVASLTFDRCRTSKSGRFPIISGDQVHLSKGRSEILPKEKHKQNQSG